MTQQELNDLLEERGITAVRFDTPSFDDAIIGITHDDRLVYCYDKMVESLVAEGMSPEEAAEFIDYNTIRALPYVENGPVVMYNLEY